MLHKFENESQWLAARRENINSTDIAAIFGLSEWKTTLKLWYEKSGMIDHEFEDTPYTIWGRRLQIPVGLGICQDNGWAAEDLSLFYLCNKETRLGASMDIIAVCPDRGRGLLEIKTTTELSEKNGWYKDKAPIDYEFQMQCQMHLAAQDMQGIEWGAIAVLDGRKNTKIYFRKYDKELGDLIDKEVKKFWRSIELIEPPKPDYIADNDLLEALRGPVKINESVNLSMNNKAVDLMNKFIEYDSMILNHRAEIARFEFQKTRAKNELLEIIGNAERATIGDWTVKTRMQETEEKFIPAHSFRRFDVSKTKRGK